MEYLCACAKRELWRRKARTVANILGYLLAVGTTVVLVTLLLFSNDAAGRILCTTGTHFVAFKPVDLAAEGASADQVEGFVGFGGRSTTLMPISVVAQAEQVRGVQDAAACLMFRFRDTDSRDTFTVAGFDPADAFVVGTTCCKKSDVLNGRFLQVEDRGVVLLEEAYATARSLKTDGKVTVAKEAFSVVGVVNPGIRPAKADIYMHIEDARRVIAKRCGETSLDGRMNVLLVEVSDARVQDEAIKGVQALPPGLLVSSYACYRPAASVLGINDAAGWLLAVVIGVCAVFWAMKSQLSSVIERRKEIGILKAMGWTDGNVVGLILLESLMQALAGGVLGCIVAVVLLVFVPFASLGNIRTPATVSISLGVLVAGSALALLGGVIAGGFPALKAASLRPADALRKF